MVVDNEATLRIKTLQSVMNSKWKEVPLALRESNAGQKPFRGQESEAEGNRDTQDRNKLLEMPGPL